MTPSEVHSGNEATATIRDVIHRARQAIGSGARLAARLRELGIGPDEGYSESAVSNWVQGRTMPPADVLLAAAGIAGISLGHQGHDSGAPEEATTDWRAIVEHLQAEVDELRTDVIHLYGQLGMNRPQVAQQPQTTQRKAQTR